MFRKEIPESIKTFEFRRPIVDMLEIKDGKKKRRERRAEERKKRK